MFLTTIIVLFRDFFVITNAVPEKMLMVYAMIFGAHLLPYGWLYQSKTYYVLSVLIPILVLFVGCNYPIATIAILMIFN